MLTQDEVGPAVMMPLRDPTFTVNRFDDPTPSSPIANACAGAASCSLREAILKSNATGGTYTIMVPNGTYTITRARISGNYTRNQRPLEVTDSVNIVCGGQAATV